MDRRFLPSSVNRTALYGSLAAIGLALIAAACSSAPSDEPAAGSTSEAVTPDRFPTLPCETPAPTLVYGGNGDGENLLFGTGFVHYYCRLPIGGDHVTIEWAPLAENGNLAGPLNTEQWVISGTGVEGPDGGSAVGDITAVVLNTCDGKDHSYLVYAYDNATDVFANDGVGLIVAAPPCGP
jgi:hypothetical protein